MSAQAKPNEPSMEEILASIRRIISDDEGKPAEAPAPVVPAPAAAEPDNDDVLDLGTEAQKLDEPSVEKAPEPAAAPQDDVEFVEPPPPAALVPPPEPETPPAPQPVAAAAEEAPVVAPPQPPAASVPAIDMAELLSEQSSAAVNAAFGQLAHTVLSNNARTLEDLVKDMLKPMLKTWLDDNLPGMVERLVRAEIERVARGGRG